ncbi:hypothetical protein EGYY_27880 [Eggerthella sp. YY7918]|nr:hypothetical protein EGYY_27880 [Eggerthella sp. YY7918]
MRITLLKLRRSNERRNPPTLRRLEAFDLAPFSLALTCEARAAAKRGNLEHLKPSR